MDPLGVLRIVWRHKLLSVPVLLLTVIGVLYVFLLGPRVYESSASYVLINPQVPTSDQIAKNPALGRLNSNNPYLRSSDPSLVVQVLTSKLNSEAVANNLVSHGFGTDYTVGPGSAFGSSLILAITASGGSPAASLGETRAIGQELVTQLSQIQTINGAAKEYLFTAIPVDVPTSATERVSSRLRSVIVVAIAGLVLMFAVVSIAQAREQAARLRSAAVESSAAQPAVGAAAGTASVYDGDLTSVYPAGSTSNGMTVANGEVAATNHEVVRPTAAIPPPAPQRRQGEQSSALTQQQADKPSLRVPSADTTRRSNVGLRRPPGATK